MAKINSLNASTGRQPFGRQAMTTNNHLRIDVAGAHGHAMCRAEQPGYLLDRAAFDELETKGAACLACIRTLELVALRERFEKAYAAYKPTFHVSDNRFALINQVLMDEDLQVYTAIHKARREMEKVNILGALEHLSKDMDTCVYQHFGVIKAIVDEYRQYKEELRFFNEAFGNEA
jgi:hypothetical protein